MFDDDEWMVKGLYEFTIRNDEEVIWSKVDGNYVTRILIVYLKNFTRKYLFLIFLISRALMMKHLSLRREPCEHLFQLFL